MTRLHDQAVDTFARAGVVARDLGVLPAAMAELAVRLDLADAGDLLASLVATDWRAGVKQTPNPTPKQPTPPPRDPPPPARPGGS